MCEAKDGSFSGVSTQSDLSPEDQAELAKLVTPTSVTPVKPRELIDARKQCSERTKPPIW